MSYPEVESVICFGEVLIDRFPDRAEFGGAPWNVAQGLAAGGVPLRLVSAVGDDRWGRDIHRQAWASGFDLTQFSIVGSPTGTATIELDGDGDATYTIESPAAWESIDEVVVPGERQLFYHGTLALRGALTRESWRRAIRGRANGALLFCDLNLRVGGPETRWVLEAASHADILKLNRDEYHFLKQHGWRARRDPQQWIFVTRGAEGAALLTPQGEIARPALQPANPVNTVGAGDAFCAGVIEGMVRGEPWHGCLDRALKFAAAACSRRGATELPSLGPGWG